MVILLNLLIAQFTKSYDEEIGRARVSVTLNRAKALSRMWNPLWMKIIVRLKTLLHCILNNNNLHGSDNKEMYFYVVVHSVLFPCHTHVCRCDTGTSLASISEYHTTDQPHLNWTLKVHMSMDALLNNGYYYMHGKDLDKKSKQFDEVHQAIHQTTRQVHKQISGM